MAPTIRSSSHGGPAGCRSRSLRRRAPRAAATASSSRRTRSCSAVPTSARSVARERPLPGFVSALQRLGLGVAPQDEAVRLVHVDLVFAGEHRELGRQPVVHRPILGRRRDGMESRADQRRVVQPGGGPTSTDTASASGPTKCDHARDPAAHDDELRPELAHHGARNVARSVPNEEKTALARASPAARSAMRSTVSSPPKRARMPRPESVLDRPAAKRHPVQLAVGRNASTAADDLAVNEEG